MKPPYSNIREYTFSEISAGAGRKRVTKDFYVIKLEGPFENENIFRPSRSDHFTIALATDGECLFQCNLINYTLRKNSFFIIPPGFVRQMHKITENYKAITLEFTKEFLTEAELHKKHIDAFTFFSSQNDPHLTINDNEAKILSNLMLFLWARDLSEDHPFRKEVIQHGFNLFLFEMAAILRKYQKNNVVKLTRKEELLMSFVKMVAQYFREERSVQYYADHLFITPKHLTKTVKELTNKTCGQFIEEMVITEAKILLDDPSMSVGNVADALHFSDQFFFSKFFKNHAGLNPSEYKSSFK
jgi:AraC family transcriptional regulator, transcriptional activator of pobA